MKRPLRSLADLKLENVGTKTFLQYVDRDCVDEIGFCQTLSCDPALFPGKNRPQRGKGRGDKALSLIYLDSPTAEVFPH